MPATTTTQHCWVAPAIYKCAPPPPPPPGCFAPGHARTQRAKLHKFSLREQSGGV